MKSPNPKAGIPLQPLPVFVLQLSLDYQSKSWDLPQSNPPPMRDTLHCSQCSEVSCSAVQCSAVQCSAVQCSAVKWCLPFVVMRSRPPLWWLPSDTTLYHPASNCIFNCTFHTAHCTLHMSHCTLHMSRCICPTAHKTMHTLRCTLNITSYIQDSLNTVQFSLYRFLRASIPTFCGWEFTHNTFSQPSLKISKLWFTVQCCIVHICIVVQF